MTLSGITTLINTITDGGENTALTVRTVLNGLASQEFILKEVKEIDVNLTSNPSFFLDNFDASGLGITEPYTGFAICNGANGTRDRGGRVAIGYDKVSYPTPGTMGGEKNHTLNTTEVPALTVPIPYNKKIASGTGAEYTLDNGGNGTPFIKNVLTNGGGQAHNNMQPYIVTLFIQRVA